MKPARWLYWFVITVTQMFFKTFYRYKVYGLEHYIEGGALVAANHVSFFDPPVIAASCPDEIHFLARHTLFKSLFGKFIAALNAHPVQRDSSNVRAIKDISQLVQQGNKVLIFPEGTRSQDNKLQLIKPGIGLLLSRSESAILPAYIHGTYEAWDRSRKFPKLWGKIAVVFGSPILWEDYADMEQREAHLLVSQRLTHSLEELRKWYEEGAEGIPP